MRFEDFLRAELGNLTRFAGALAGDRHLAEDVLSDALLAVSTRWTKISAMEFPAAYVQRVVVTTFLSDRRKTRRQRTRATDDMTALDHAVPDCADIVTERDQVKHLLSELTPKQRAAVVLRYLCDRTDEEIAEHLGCTTGTVRAHLSHARTALRLAGGERHGCRSAD